MGDNNKMVLYAFAMNTAYNLWSDNSNDPFITKLGRAALSSIPLSLTLDTKDIVQCAANKMNIEVHQPSTTYQSMKIILDGSVENLNNYAKENKMPAYYVREEDRFKNLS